jgi:hypothetical protein
LPSVLQSPKPQLIDTTTTPTLLTHPPPTPHSKKSNNYRNNPKENPTIKAPENQTTIFIDHQKPNYNAWKEKPLLGDEHGRQHKTTEDKNNKHKTHKSREWRPGRERERERERERDARGARRLSGTSKP